MQRKKKVLKLKRYTYDMQLPYIRKDRGKQKHQKTPSLHDSSTPNFGINGFITTKAGYHSSRARV